MQPDNLDITTIVSPHVLWILCGLLALAIIGSITVWWVRRWSRQPETILTGGFTLGALRKLRKEGKMSEDEYKRTSELLANKQKFKLLAGDKPKPVPAAPLDPLPPPENPPKQPN